MSHNMTSMKLQNLRPITFLYLILFLHAESTQPPFACDSSDPKTSSYPFCRTSLPISKRVRDLVSRLTLDEKVDQLVNTVPPIPRLGIPAYEWWSEALHGVANTGLGIILPGTIPAATSFPQVILTAATFDQNLWYRIGQVIGIEARAIYNAGQAKGMTFWAPNINIFRDPRWGRGQETPGEDPLVTRKYAVAFVRGVQGDSIGGEKLQKRGGLQASACCKHFTAYDLENWNGVDRFHFDAKVSKQDLADTYQPSFESCVKEGKASGIMCAYNSVNGIPSCTNFDFLSKTARKDWSFHGYITSDCDALYTTQNFQNYTKTPEDLVAASLNAGMDVNCGLFLKNHTKSAVQQGKVSISQVDRALHNLFSIRMRLGLFDGNPSKLRYGEIGPNRACSQHHQQLALEAALNGIVLLKNSKKLLPFSKSKTSSLAVVGPNAKIYQTLLGNYAGIPCKSISPLQSLQSYVKNTIYHPGCDFVNCTSSSVDEAVRIVKEAGRVVLFMGLDQGEEREGQDRVHLELPGKQVEVITSVARAAKMPVVLVIIGGGPVDISFAKFDEKIGSILWAGYPGEAGGQALAKIIFGEHNPGGRLPLTWYPKDFIKVPMTDMRMRPAPSTGYPGRTYRFYTGPKVFEFGYGLSYSNYVYEFSTLSSSQIDLGPIQTAEKSKQFLVSELGEWNCKSKMLNVSIGVRNDGEMEGKHPVLLFVRPEKVGDNSRLIKQLVGFKSVSLKGGEKAEVEFAVDPCEHLSRANEDGLMVVEEGSYSLIVGEVEHPIHFSL